MVGEVHRKCVRTGETTPDGVSEILDRTGSSVLEVITLLTPRYDHSVATLPDGDVIVIAGKNPDMLEYYATAERVFLSRLP